MPLINNKKLTVEKIGGTSMSRFGDVMKNILMPYGKIAYNRVFVVSAYGGVTDQLLEHKKTGEDGVYQHLRKGEDYRPHFDKLYEHFLSINKSFRSIGLNQKEAKTFLEQRFRATKSILDSLLDVLSSGYVLRENLLLASRELLASLGEAHSAWNSVNILKANGVNARFVDLSGIGDSHQYTIDERIKREMSRYKPDKEMLIVTGYTKGIEGIMREFDRGYSEITFSKIATHLKVDEAVIHKEYHLSSADPKVVGLENSVIVGNTNYDVADQLADVGMEAIHPQASKPLEKLGIPLRIKNTFEPEHPGTLIDKDYIGPESKVEIITGSDQVTILEIHDPGMVGAVGFDLGILKILAKHRISYILKTTNANSITHLLWDKDVTKSLLKELRFHYELVKIKKAAIVCTIGSNIAKPGVLERATKALSESKINIDCVSQSLRQVNMQFIISRTRFDKAVIALNQALCVEKF